jgi:hypothetical protein
VSWYGITFTVGFFVQIFIVVGLVWAFTNFFQNRKFRFGFDGWLADFREQDGLIKFGLMATFMILFMVFVLFGFEHCEGKENCQNKLVSLIKSSPSEVGDTLAGVASALAFLWIILTVKMQSNEMKEQRKEFTQQREATQAMARTMASQAKIFEGEQRQRDEFQAEKLLEEKLRSLLFAVSETLDRGLNWHFSDDIIDDEFGSRGQMLSESIGQRSDENLTIDEAAIVLRRRLAVMNDRMWDLLHMSVDVRFPKKSELIPELVTSIQSIIAMKDNLSSPQKVRLERLRLDEIATSLITLTDTPEFWEEH